LGNNNGQGTLHSLVLQLCFVENLWVCSIDVLSLYLGSATIKRHEDIQGEILEGLVARVVAANNTTCLQHTLHQSPQPSCSKGTRMYYGSHQASSSYASFQHCSGVGWNLMLYCALHFPSLSYSGHGLREIFLANRENEKKVPYIAS
jgi:hypothetical protein